MATAYHHAKSSAKKFGGLWDEYIAIHEWFDESKMFCGDFRHRALRHHTAGIQEATQKFGVLLINSDKREIPIRWIAEQHVLEDCGYLPSVNDWLEQIQPQSWMNHPRKLSKELEEE